MMAQAPPTDNEVLRAIEILEESRISFLNFDFITENEIQNKHNQLKFKFRNN